MGSFKHFRVIEKKEQTGETYYLIEYKKYKYFSIWGISMIPCYNTNPYLFKNPYIYYHDYFKISNIENAQKYCALLNTYYKKKYKGYYIFPVFKSSDKTLYGYCVSSIKPKYTDMGWYNMVPHIENPIISLEETDIDNAINSVTNIKNNLKYKKVIDNEYTQSS